MWHARPLVSGLDRPRKVQPVTALSVPLRTSAPLRASRVTHPTMRLYFLPDEKVVELRIVQPVAMAPSPSNCSVVTSESLILQSVPRNTSAFDTTREMTQSSPA